MVTGYYVGTAAVGVVGAGATIAAKNLRAARPIAISGMSGVGKTGLIKCIMQDLQPIFDMKHEPTVGRERRRKKKLNLEKYGKATVKMIDYEGGPKYVQEQVDTTHARLAIVMVDVERWGDQENWEIINELVLKITSPAYQRKHTAKYWMWWTPWNGWTQNRVPFTGKGIKMVTIMLNKVDLINPSDRVWFCRGVADHFLKEQDGNPLNKIRHDVYLQFIATSLKHGIYYPYANLESEPKKLDHYFAEVMKYI